MSINPVAAGGFSSAAASYARIRPTYARPAVGEVADAARAAGPVARTLDVAAGTGILTGQLARLGLAVTALEPLDPMARHLVRAVPAAPVVLGVAEHLPFRADTFSLCTVAQAFHWFDAPAALEELARVLAPGGELFLLWNARDQLEPWVAALTDLVEAHTGGRPYDDHREQPWDRVVAASGRFGPLTTRRWPNPVPTDVDGVLERLRSTSFVATLGADERDALLAEAQELLTGRFGLSGRFDYPHDTVLHRCRVLD
ncbi:MAG: class I SAM-dependent methyltransferase [Microthrixaceae bacterium]